jgi:prepilin-type N-terminal cleavage/methylation domain-containing protein
MNKKGVTLLELIIVMVIIAVGAVLIAPNIGTWIPNYRLRGAARDIVSTMRVAQMKAVSLNTNHQVSFDPGARTYLLQRDSGGIWIDEQHPQLLPPGITFHTNFTNNRALFRPNATANGGSVFLTNARGTQRTITVLLSTGRITIK